MCCIPGVTVGCTVSIENVEIRMDMPITVYPIDIGLKVHIFSGFKYSTVPQKPDIRYLKQ